MASPTDSVELARDRIRRAYSPQLLHSSGNLILSRLRDHLESVQSSRENVLNWNAPEDNVRLATRSLSESEPSESTQFVSSRIDQLVEQILRHGNNLHDPRYIGHQVPAPVPIAALFDFVGSLTNQVMAIYEMGPWATSVEQAVVDELGRRIGWPKGAFSGLATHGGSLANFTALLTARNVRLPDSWEQGLTGRSSPVLIVHADAHYSVTRTAGMLGIGSRNVIRAQLDEKRRIDPNRLDEMLSALRKRNQSIVALAACACATPIGAFDRLNELAEVCRRHEVWLHVDAAHGGAALFSERHRHLLDGLKFADSLVWDAHKMLFVPALCALVFYKEADHRYRTFHQDAPYLFDPSATELSRYDSGIWTVECTKRAAVFGLWGIWSVFGSRLFEDMVDVTFHTASQFHEMLSRAEDFQPLHKPDCNIVAFRYVPREMQDATHQKIGQFQRDIRRMLIRSGEFYIVQTSIDDIGTLRLTVCNPLTTESDLANLMDAIRKTGKSILRGNH